MKLHLDYFRHTLQKKIFKFAKSLYQCDKNMYSFEDFKLHLCIEKRRSERVNCKSSIVFFNVKHLVHGNGKQHNPRLEDIAKIICSTIRKTDVVSIYKSQTILILLLDTNCCGAQCACKRIVREIMDCYSSSKLTHEHFHIKILSFPEKQIEKTAMDDIIADDTIAEYMKISSDSHVANEMIFKRDYFENLSLCISNFNGSAISMRIDQTFFWDQELVSKYLLIGKKVTKRLMDILGALCALVLLFPLMLIIAVGVKLTSPGPILFKQRRAGYKGIYFTFLKFRSMVAGNEDRLHQDYVRKLINGENDQINTGTREKPCYKIRNDPRTTPFGQFLRKTSLDELPQLFNVLKGEMSLVGPRPPIPYEVNEYKKWHYRRILEVKPGITGLWQVSGRNRTSFDDMVRLDIKYAENWSLTMDLKILFKTFKAVFAADGE
ncbi:sugar transferase [candidate division KSB1 bacterium]|nr:sugar transferase [candidate division KSB1 bacterium]RQW01175.1 MAG: sugar transferase [candidate division KSB1 bacterium]